jgi:hypothetical protein
MHSVASISKVSGRGNLCHKKVNVLHNASVNISNVTVYDETGYWTAEEV